MEETTYICERCGERVPAGCLHDGSRYDFVPGLRGYVHDCL